MNLSCELRQETPEDIGQLISAVANHEMKALLCAAMTPDRVYGHSQLHNLLISLQGDNPTWATNAGTTWDYCVASLAPIGFVAKEIIDPDRGIVGFRKTRRGEVLGKSISGHFLDYSLSHPNVSLQKISGQTATRWGSGVRSPMTRIEIFGEILTRELPVRVNDVLPTSRRDDMRRSNQVRALARAGLIQLKKPESSQEIAKYSIGVEPFDSFEFHPKRSPMPSQIRDVILANLASPSDEITVPQIISALISVEPKYGEIEYESLRRTIAATLRRFESMGFIKNTAIFDKKHRSEITLTPNQRRDLEDYLTLVWNAQDLDENFLQVGREKARLILSNPESVKELAEKARRDSVHANAQTFKSRSSEVLDLLRLNPGATSVDIDTVLSERGIHLSRNYIHTILGSLARDGVIKSKKINRQAVSWFVINNG